MRKLLAGIILAVALPAAATLTEDLQAGDQSVEEIVSNALAGCDGAACEEAVLVESLEAGVDSATVNSVATASGVSPDTINNAVANANSGNNQGNSQSGSSNKGNSKGKAQGNNTTPVYLNENGEFSSANDIAEDSISPAN